MKHPISERKESGISGPVTEVSADSSQLDCVRSDKTRELINAERFSSLEPSWQNVSFCRHIFVFSSFSYFQNMVTITGAALRDMLTVKKKPLLYCQFYDIDPNTWLTCSETTAQYKPMPESRGRRCVISSFICMCFEL